MREFSMGDAWNEAMAMLRPNWVLYGGVTLTTLIFTSLVTYLLSPESLTAAFNPLKADANVGWTSGQTAAEAISSTITSIVGLIPSLFIWRHALGRGVDTQTSLVYGAVAAIPYLVGFIMILIPVAIGFVLLVVPGLYLYARIGLFGQVMAANGSYNMIEAIGKSWEITRDNGFRIVLYYIILGIVYVLIAGLVMAILGFGAFSAGSSFSDFGVGTIILMVLLGLPLYVLVSLIGTVVPAGIYRTLTDDDSVTDVFG